MIPREGGKAHGAQGGNTATGQRTHQASLSSEPASFSALSTCICFLPRIATCARTAKGAAAVRRLHRKKSQRRTEQAATSSGKYSA